MLLGSLYDGEDTLKIKFSKRTLGLIFLVLGVIATLVAVTLGFRVAYRLISGPPPVRERQSDVSVIRDWMTLGYVSKTYGIPGPDLEKSLNLQPDDYRKMSIEAIAKKNNKSSDELLESIRKVVTEFQKTHPTPPANEPVPLEGTQDMPGGRQE